MFLENCIQIHPVVFALKRQINKQKVSDADTGGVQGMHPPTRPKEVLKWHLISLKIIAKILLYCTLLAKDVKIKLMLTISQKHFFVSLDELALFIEPDIK